MVKRFCDLCKAEITKENTAMSAGAMSPGRMTAQIDRKGVSLKVEILQTLSGCANAGDVCKYCLLDALYALDDRLKAKDA